MQLTDAQRSAINHAGGNLQLIACAGSGKTEVVAQRVVHLLDPQRGGLAPANIIAFTFALFDRKRRSTKYKDAGSGYISAWYLDEDYDGDCFVDCQLFFDFKKTPNIKAALRAEIEPDEFKLKLTSEPFVPRQYKRIAVKVVDVYETSRPWCAISEAP